MDIGRPYAAISPSLDGDILVAVSRTTRPLSGRHVAELVAAGSPDGVRKALNRLVDQGIVLRERAGPALMHTLNREHVGAPAVEALATMRSALLGRLREAISSWPTPAAHASMFGSAARGDGDANSDIDIFLVRPDRIDQDDPIWRGQCDRLAADVLRWTGNDAGLIECSEGQLQEMVRSGAPVIDALRSDAIRLGEGELELDSWTGK